MKKDLRYFLKTVEERTPEFFLRIKKEVSPRWELSSVQKRLEAEDRLPIVVFEKIQNHDMPIVTNLFASKRHLALALETSPREVVTRFTEAQKNRIKPRVVNSGPVKDVILTGDKADLRTLPIVTHCEKDAGPPGHGVPRFAGPPDARREPPGRTCRQGPGPGDASPT